MASPVPAKFFVNQGVVTSRTDMLHLLRPLLKQTVTYRLEFDTRPDQLLVYTLVQGDERVVVEFAPIGPAADDTPFAPRQLAFDTSDFVQMELLGLEAREDE